jgi:hypothetical protein
MLELVLKRIAELPVVARELNAPVLAALRYVADSRVQLKV